MRIILYILIISISFSQSYNGPIDPAGDVSAVRNSYMDGNRVYLYFQNTTELSDWAPGGLSDVSIWPNDGTGTRMVDGIALMVGGKVYIEDDGNPLTSVPPSKFMGTISLISMSLAILYSI